MKTYKFHHDGGHGWLEVPRADLMASGVMAKISACSYQSSDGETVYLEEDCDASAFCRAIQQAGTEPVIREVNDGEYSPIRKLPQFKA